MSGSVFRRQTDGLQYARGFLVSVVLTVAFWWAVMALVRWAGP